MGRGLQGTRTHSPAVLDSPQRLLSTCRELFYRTKRSLEIRRIKIAGFPSWRTGHGIHDVRIAARIRQLEPALRPRSAPVAVFQADPSTDSQANPDDRSQNPGYRLRHWPVCGQGVAKIPRGTA